MLHLLKRKPRLLFLDDDPSMQRLVARLLQRQGHRVDVVSSGTQAIDKLRRHNYDVLLLDVMTPTDGGMTVIRHLRTAAPELLERVVLVTASPQSVLNAVAGDVFAVIHKPFEPAQLTDMVERLVKA